MKNFYKNELQWLVLFVASILVFYPLSLLGILYNLGKSVYDGFRSKYWKKLETRHKWLGLFIIPAFIIYYWLKVIYQLWCCIKYYLKEAALTNDYLANTFAGELVEDFSTTREITWFGKAKHTLSAAIGKEENDGYLVSTGKGLTKLLSITLGKNHSIEAYNHELKK